MHDDRNQTLVAQSAPVHSIEDPFASVRTPECPMGPEVRATRGVQYPLVVLEGVERAAADRDFLVARVDSTDQKTHHLRSGISMLLGFLTAVVALFMNRNQPLTEMEGYLMYASLALAALSAISVLISFADTSVYSYGVSLREDLLPEGQSVSVYNDQLREMVKKKQDINSRMKAVSGTGLFAFTLILAIGYVAPVINGIPQTGDALLGLLRAIHHTLLTLLVLLVTVAVVATLGIIQLWTPRTMDED